MMATYSLILNNKKHTNYLNISISDNLDWIDFESYISYNKMDDCFSVLEIHIARIKTIMRSLDIKLKITFKDVKQEFREFITKLIDSPENSHDIMLMNKQSEHTVDFLGQIPKQDNLDRKDLMKYSVSPNSQSKHKSIPENISADARRVLEIMKKIGKAKWPNFFEESSKYTCMNYIRNNLIGIQTIPVERIYKEICDFVLANPEFGKE